MKQTKSIFILAAEFGFFGANIDYLEKHAVLGRAATLIVVLEEEGSGFAV
jgi:hypothetical protein